MKTSIQSNIELGQDINNTWALVAAGFCCDYDLEKRFKILFPDVQAANAWARQQAADKAEMDRGAPFPSSTGDTFSAEKIAAQTNEQIIAEMNALKIARKNSGFGVRA